MKIGKYSIDSVWLSIILGFIFVALVSPFMWVSVLVLIIFAIKKDKIKEEEWSKSLDYFALRKYCTIKLKMLMLTVFSNFVPIPWFPESYLMKWFQYYYYVLYMW